MPKLVRKPLTVRQVETLPSGTYTDGNGLYLVVGPRSRSWILRYQFRGRRRDMGLGSTRWVSLRDAREKAYEAHRALRVEGVDPLDKRRGVTAAAITAAELKTKTFEECTMEYIQMKRPSWIPKHAKSWEASMRNYIFPEIGTLPIVKINAKVVKDVLEPIREPHPKLYKDFCGRLGAVIDYAIQMEWYEKANPVRGIVSMMPSAADTKHHPSLPVEEVPVFMRQLRAVEDLPRLATEFIILCGSRRDEVRQAPWCEFNLDEKLWTIPKERMLKGSSEHIVPLSDAAMRILNKMKQLRVNDYVFPGVTSPFMNPNAVPNVVKQLRPDIVLHGFRATFSTWANASGKWPSDLIEYALSHTVGTEVKRAYDRQSMVELRRGLMDAWAAYCAGDAHNG